MLRSSPLKRKAPLGQRGPILKSTPTFRQRKCAVKGCSNRFQARNISHKCCGAECAEIYAIAERKRLAAKQAKAERAETKAKLLALEPLEYYLKKAERACNAYIRARDAGQGCISCGRHDADVWNAGHFISVGANSTLRYDEDNIHLQCARPCNKDKGGNIVEYRKALLKKIGPERLTRLEGWHSPVKRTVDDVLAIEAHYKAKLKALKETT
jgi:predicted nucleic acid-binding protein